MVGQPRPRGRTPGAVFGRVRRRRVRTRRGQPPQRPVVLPCLSNTTGGLVDGLECTEITDLLQARLRDLGWPASMRVIVRRRKLYDHEQPTLFDTNVLRH